MSKVVDFEAGRDRHAHRHKDQRAARLRDELRNARESAPAQDESTRKLLALFKRKPAPKR